MDEYWSSSCKACQKILEEKSQFIDLPTQAPKAFRQLRPWVHHGWEMVLIAAEFIRPNSSLKNEGFDSFSKHYSVKCSEALDFWQWHPKQLQNALDSVRNESIKTNPTDWLSSHKPFPGIVDRLNNFKDEGIDIAVLTTKGTSFTAELLNHLNIKITLLFGHESGSKINVLQHLVSNHNIKGFIEDRRATLEEVIKTPDLFSIPCYLATWGYLKPNDSKDLPPEIHLLKNTTFSTPLANWNSLARVRLY